MNVDHTKLTFANWIGNGFILQFKAFYSYADWTKFFSLSLLLSLFLPSLSFITWQVF